MEVLMRHRWPGNVRELQHVIQRAVILSHGSSLQLPLLDARARTPRTVSAAGSFDDAARQHILEVLRETNGVVAGARGAAVRLGLKRTTLLSKMERLGIGPEDVRASLGPRAEEQPARSLAM
jgi:formate hydrogenlyase transcriptional activator